MVDLDYNFECDWLIELSDNKLSDNNLSDNNLASELLASYADVLRLVTRSSWGRTSEWPEASDLLENMRLLI